MSKKRRGLGRGLDALLAEPPAPSATQEATPEPATTEVARSATATPRTLRVDRLEPNRFQPRHDFDAGGLEELAESIRAQGVVQPIVVTPLAGDDEPGYAIVAGERRWRAAQLAGLDEVPVVVREVADDRELLELALVENLQRSDLNPIEEAEAYRELHERFELSQEAVARRVGKARSTVTNGLRLLRLPPEVQDLLRRGELSAGQARPLLAVGDAERQTELAHRAVAEGWSARRIEELTRERKPAEERRREPEPTEVHAAAAAEKLTRHLQSPVAIKRRGRGGIVTIRFHSEEELMRLYDLLMARRGTS